MGLNQHPSASCGRQKSRHMELIWILLGLACWALALVFVLILMWMAGTQDRSARHEQKTIYPLSDITITQIDEPTTRH
jgi:flagellar basal body-associated protein FliL